MGKTLDTGPASEFARLRLPEAQLRLAISVDFRDMADRASFHWQAGGAWQQIGPAHQLCFGLDHFTGCRFGLFLLSDKLLGGEVAFQDFRPEQALLAVS
jgi:hypothetical protein